MAVKESDVIIGAVLVPGRRAPDVVTKAMIRTMNPGAVIVDVAIDQGGCTEISMPPTSHSHPVRYVSIDSPDESEQDLQEAKGRFKGRHIIMYSVPNMPGAVPRTSTLGITNATLKYAQALAKKGLENAIKEDAALMKGVNTYKGHLTCKGVADALGMKFTPAESVFS